MAFLVPDNLKSRRDIPEAMKRVAKAFEIGLDDSATVWFEPPFDPTGEKPHYVVLLPDRGIAVLEVLEARSEKILGILRGRLRLERDGREVDAPSPLVRAEALADALRARIAAEPRLEGMSVPVAAGAALVNTTAEAAQRIGVEKVLPPERVLFKDQIQAAIDGQGEAELQRAFARMLGPGREEALDDEAAKVVRGLIQPETVIDRVASSSEGNQLSIFRAPEGSEDVIRIMDLRQEAMAKSLGDGHRVIRGVAGSGKTLVLVYRAALMARIYPSRKFLLTCYSKALAGELRSQMHDHPNVEVLNLDKLIVRMLRKANLPVSYDDEDASEKLAALALTQALPKVAEPRYHGLFVDEAQDFGTNALKFSLALLEPGVDDVIIVADAAQNIFRRKFRWKDAGIQAQGRTRILRTNYRNTREILDFAYKFLIAGSARPDESPDFEDENAVIPPESTTRTGPVPEVTLVRDSDAEIRAAVEKVSQLAKGGRQPRQIALLYATSTGNGGSRPLRLHDELKRCGVDVFWATNPKDWTAKERIGQTDSPVVLSTIHTAKGLEFPDVVLCGLGREGEDPDANRKLAYVGMTRATRGLTVIASGDSPFAEDLRKACA